MAHPAAMVLEGVMDPMVAMVMVPHLDRGRMTYANACRPLCNPTRW
jgi:hypothetical protein